MASWNGTYDQALGRDGELVSAAQKNLTKIPLITRKEVFIYDGVEYPTKSDAEKAHVEKVGKAEYEYGKFMETYSGKRLIAKHNLDEVGVWAIYGEGEPDLGAGPAPLLGYFRGKLRDVVRYGVALPRFWNWGGGGDIRKIEIMDIDSQ